MQSQKSCHRSLMPEMSGTEVLQRIKDNAATGRLPVILVTARASPADRERGIGVGANAYIVKSNFDQSDLLNTLRRLV